MRSVGLVMPHIGIAGIGNPASSGKVLSTDSSKEARSSRGGGVTESLRPTRLIGSLIRSVSPAAYDGFEERSAHFFAHWEKERILVSHHRHLFILGVVWQYVHSVATNVAYYLHTPRTLLRDLGFLVFPPLSTQMQVLSEIFFFLLVAVTLSFAFSPFFRRKEPQRGTTRGEGLVDLPNLPQSPASSPAPAQLAPSPSLPLASPAAYHLRPPAGPPPQPPLFTFLMLARFTKVLVLTQTLRCVAFLVTSLPGPNYHCRPGAPDYSPPEGWFDVVARQDAFKGCGDLVFSSHTIFLVLCALVIQKYSPNTTFKQTVWGLVCVFAMFCVAARKHYTLDIVVACYTVPLIWVVLDKYYPDALPPKLAALLDQERQRQQLIDSGAYLGEDYVAVERPPAVDSVRRMA